jgi:hypothetical protein
MVSIAPRRDDDVEKRKHMSIDETKKFPFAGPAWIDVARDVLTDLVTRHGEEGRTFSVCEIFTNAPTEVAPSGVAAWHFVIDGKSVIVGAGERAGTDATIRADYQAALPVARLIYTPEFLAKRAAKAAAERAASGASPNAEGNTKEAPPYMVELHNRMAAVTA